MVDPYDEDDLDSGASRPRQARSPVLAVLLPFLALIAVVSGYVWLTDGRSVEVATPVVNPEVTETLQGLRALQQRTARKIEAIEQNVVAARADLKKLSGQVSALAARVDALQNVATAPSNAAWPSPLFNPKPDPGAQAITLPSKSRSWRLKPPGPDAIGGATSSTAPAPGREDQR